MKQIALDLKNGNISLLDCPDPVVGKGELLIEGRCSLVSPGTERMLLRFGSGSWLSKARQQPEKLKQTFQKIKTDGWAATRKAVQSKLSQPMPLGYSHVGRVAAIGEGVSGFKVGDRVVSNGHHAGKVIVAQNLAAKIPEEVRDEAAAFTVPGAIALQSIRLLQPTFGETIVVVGAGLIGQLTARLLQANGCRVLVTDKYAARLRLLPAGIGSLQDVDQLDAAFENVDGVIITAATHDKTLVNQCAAICRKRGRIILSGVAPVQFDRTLLYKKEISFQVSCSYGPGRYDSAYEREGIDYPIGFVRWTAQRNFQAILEALRLGQLNVDGLISLEIPVAEASAVYQQFRQNKSELLTALFTYAEEKRTEIPVLAAALNPPAAGGRKIAIAGAGQFTSGVILPILKELKAPVKIIAGKNGFHAAALAKQYQLPEAAAGFESLLSDSDIGLIVITTPHQFHAAMAVQALEAGKDVFVEKPMAINRTGLATIIAAKAATNRLVYVGYNRRFASLAIKAKALLKTRAQPPFIIYNINAGKGPEAHWLQQQESGGRLIGELCHFIDLCVFLQGALVKSVFAKSTGREDVTAVLTFQNQAQAVINYFSQGHSAYPKERLELHAGGRSMVIDNWRSLKGYGFKSGSGFLNRQDKGHKAQFRELLASWPERKELIPFLELVNVGSATLAVVESMELGSDVQVP